jgi:hypothetical protein
MDEQELERRLGELKETWRIPGDPPLEEIWQVVEARVYPERPRQRYWARRLLPLAAVLLLGFGLGQLVPPLLSHRTPGTTTTVPVIPVVATDRSRDPFVGIATDYIERVTGLLVTLTDAPQRGHAIPIAQARELLATTRLLMDSPQASDPHLRALLDDLELVLAQIVRLPARAASPDVYLIDQTVDQREVLPRLRGLLAENSTSQP